MEAMVIRRNARERCRVMAVNEMYKTLQHLIPWISKKKKRVSKLKTLKSAALYINELQRTLSTSEAKIKFFSDLKF